MKQKFNIDKMKEIMQKKKLGNTELAEKLGYSRSNIWRILNKGVTPGTNFINCLLEFEPDCKYEELFVMEDDENEGNYGTNSGSIKVSQ
ncbi:MAG TPA: hypothetical protein DCP90_02090 [Clostridiales bacterium]|nr:MAG: hypothetical protein A2Y22_08570 [Clostridiales bacterium GWD2_32_59]HAN09384.1 hypothetical protein [Clostridiales bacterium]